jgi:hypothetical protein
MLTNHRFIVHGHTHTLGMGANEPWYRWPDTESNVAER